MNRALKAFLAVLGPVGAIVAILLIPDPWWRGVTILLLLLTAIVIIIGVFFWRRLTVWSRESGIEPEFLPLIKTRCTLEQTRPDEIAWIAGLEARHFGTDAVPENILRAWYDANPNGFTIISTNAGIPIGHIDVLPVRPDSFRNFIEGRITEKDLSADSIFRPRDRKKIRDLYVESVIVESDSRFLRASGVHTAMTRIPQLVKRICEAARVKNLYALGATEGGRKFMKDLGFQVIMKGTDRIDQMDLFCIRYRRLMSNLRRNGNR
jgi:hypothetical protein